MTPASVAVALWPGLRKAAIKFGLWIVRELVKLGARLLQKLCARRIRKLKRKGAKVALKQSRARGDKKIMRLARRRQFIDYRMAAWRKLSEWLSDKVPDLEAKINEQLYSLAEKHLPEEAPEWAIPST